MVNQENPSDPIRVSPVTRTLLLFVKAYRYCISPLFPGSCRFYPTCSSYAMEALKRYGAITGTWLTIKRLMRCHPWGDQGIDMVPDLEKHSSSCCQRKP